MDDNPSTSRTISGFERQIFERTLSCMVREVIGYNTTIELRNEIEVTGHVTHVDGLMNVTMTNVVYQRPYRDPMKLEHIHIHGRNIRFIHIPDVINMRKAIVNQLDRHRHDSRLYGTKIRASYVEKKRSEREAIMEKIKKDNKDDKV